jgi:hypothetical protein
MLQLDLADAASAPHFTNLASQRLAQSAAEAAVPPEVPPDVPPEVPPDVPVGVDAVVDEQAAAAPRASTARDTREERERGRNFMTTGWRTSRNPSLEK